MSRPKITEPITDNKARAEKENRNPPRAADEGEGGPSRARHLNPSRGHHSKKSGGSAPKQGGSPTS
ncbi:MAG TPA: hypothetical protein VGF69_15985 [Thermoanaerobaculia bacterium]|jgi:hypothetical protein